MLNAHRGITTDRLLTHFANTNTTNVELVCEVRSSVAAIYMALNCVRMFGAVKYTLKLVHERVPVLYL